MNKYLLTLALASLAGSSFALGNTGTAWAGLGCGGEQSTTAGFRYCMVNMSSATTVAQLGKQTVYPNKQIFVVGGISGSAVANVVTPTITLYLGNRVVATQNISVSTVGNVVNLGSVPYFNAISVSQSQPGLISQTNGLVISIIENDK